MSKIYMIILLGLGLSFAASAQQATPTVKDTTTVRFIVKINVQNPGVYKNITRYTITGDTEDPIVRDIPYDNSNVEVGMFFVDNSGKIFKIEAIAARNPLIFDVSVLAGNADPNLLPAAGSGVIYKPTPNLLLPQWVTSMSSTIQGALLSHMANMIDLKLGTIPSSSIAIKTANYTLSSTDDTILFDATSASTGITMTLPPAATNVGKSFKIGKIDDTANKIIFSPNLKLTSTISIPDLNYSRTFIIQSDGTNWWVVNQY